MKRILILAALLMAAVTALAQDKQAAAHDSHARRGDAPHAHIPRFPDVQRPPGRDLPAGGVRMRADSHGLRLGGGRAPGAQRFRT